MKYKSLLLLFCMTVVFCMNIYAQATHTIELVYNDEDFELTGQENNAAIFSKLDGLVWDSDTLAPALPYICVNVLIGPNEEYNDFSYSNTEKLYRANIVIAPNEKPVATNLDLKKMQKADDIIYSNIDYPVTSIVYTGTNIMDGYKYAGFLVCPFRYNAFEKKLYLNKKITLNVMTTALEQPTNVVMADVARYKNMHDAVASLVCNPYIMDTLYCPASLQEISYEYVIITNKSYAPAFQRLANWKTLKGIRTNVVTTEEIYNTFDGNTPQLKIKNALFHYYNNGMKYALLGGDVDVIPAQMVKLPYIRSDVATETPADVFYSCFDNCFDWDENNNGIYGEIEDNIDFSPEIVLTRCPVRSIDEVINFSERIISYEGNPNMDNWQDKLLMVGVKLKNDTVVYNGVEMLDSRSYSEQMYDSSIKPYWAGKPIRFFTDYTDIKGLPSNYFPPSVLRDEISKGYTFVDVNTHGHYSGWGWFLWNLHPEGKYLFYKKYADGVNNKGNTIITTTACETNAFDFDNECLSESFINNSNSGIIGYLGSSREGWINYSHSFNKSFYQNLLSSKNKCFGEAVVNMKNSFSSAYASGYCYKWLYLSLNPIGDPEMPVFVSKPRFMFPIVKYEKGNLLISTNLEDCKVCIMQKAISDEVHYKVEPFNYNYSQSNLSGELTLSITKNGYIPYVCRINDVVYLQNEVFNLNNIDIIANKVFAGKNVTTEQSSGDFILNNASTKIKYTDYVVLDAGFEVKLGTELNIMQINKGVY